MADPAAAAAPSEAPRGPATGSDAPDSLAALAVFAVAFAIYLRTLLPGVSVGDWAEMQFVPARLAIPHPTGYPLYVLLGWLFSLIPVGSVGFRAELLSAAAAAGAAATCVLITRRLGVRMPIAIAAGLTLAVSGELWLEATYSEMNGLHLFLVAAVIHRAIVWRAERRDRDLLVGALLAGLSLSNHLLAATVVPIVVVFVLLDARSRLIERPVLLVEAAGLLLLGLTPYLFIPIRAWFGPAEIYGRFLTWDGFSSLVSGADFRRDMHFTSGDSLAKAWRAVPDLLAQFQTRSNVVAVAGGLVGAAIQLVIDRWLATLLIAIVAVNIFFFANYVGDLDHYLLVTWLALAIWLAVGAEALLGWIEARLPRLRAAPATALLALALPAAIALSNWPTYDQSGNRIGEDFGATVYANLPRDAVLLTYWDALTTLSYLHCADGWRPDVSLRAFDTAARVVCDRVAGSLEEVAAERPLFALFAIDSELDALRGRFTFIAGPRIAVPYGQRYLDHTGTLYRLVPNASAVEPGAGRRPG